MEAEYISIILSVDHFYDKNIPLYGLLNTQDVNLFMN